MDFVGQYVQLKKAGRNFKGLFTDAEHLKRALERKAGTFLIAAGELETVAGPDLAE